ncbi:MAG: copper chaperone PCu(A)C [Methylophagaceae bacterium]
MNNSKVVKSIFILLALLMTLSSTVYADLHPNIETENIWVVLPPEVARSTAAYGIIKNSGAAPDTLLNIRSDAGTVMLHKTDIDSGMAQMIHMPNMIIEAGEQLVLKPMSFHLMFSDLCPIIFIEGGSIAIFLEFEKSGLIEVEVPIRSAWENY